MGTCFLLSGLLGPVWHMFSIILVDLERDFGGSRIDTSFAFSVFALSHALSTPVLAKALMRFDSRKLMAGFALVLAAGLWFASHARSLTQFYVAYGLIAGIGTQAFGSYFIFSLISNRIRRRPGMSTALADAGAGVGIFIGLPLLYRIHEVADWRAGFVVLAAFIAVAGPTAHMLLLPRLRLPSQGTVLQPVRDARTMFVTATLSVSMLLGTIVLQALQTHQVAAFQHFGATPEAAVWTVSIAGLTVFASRIAAGFLIDRFGPMRSMAFSAIGAGWVFIAVLLFAGYGRDIWLFVYTVALATGFGPQGIIFAMQLKQLLSSRALLFSFSLTRLSAGVGLFAGPVIGALSYTHLGGYTGMFIVLASLASVHFALFFLSRQKPT